MMKVIAAVAAAVLGLVFPSFAEENLVARATSYLGDTGERVFQLDIVEITSKAAPNQSGQQIDITREVRIRCVSGCNRDVSYREVVDVPPFGGAFVLRDDSPEFVTTWGGGSAYHVRIYRVEGDHIAKVLEEGTKSFPQFVMDHDGSFITVLTDPDSPHKVRKITLRGILWRNGPKGYAANGGRRR
jgi:hypothetical protein